ncbi:MAG: hypothetical protein TU36_000615 [Vulcanisaeta sp. AZ3]|jgi:tRNA threonylcarbamoyladenosine modification (KEOPS) complex Cgi121 subunit
MNKTIKLTSDIGELKIWLATTILNKALDEETLNKIKNATQNCEETLVTIAPANKILNAWHMIYPTYLSLRDHIRGTTKYKDPSLGALAYMAGTTQLRKALNTLNPIGHREITIIIMGTKDCTTNTIKDVLNIIKEITTDIILGAGAYKKYEGNYKTIEEYTNKLINEYINTYT